MLKSIIFFLALLCASSSLFSQFTFGIQLAYNQSNPQIEKSDWDALGIADLEDITVNKGFGFGIGILGTYAISKHLSITTQPSLNFSESSLDYNFTTVDIDPIKLEMVVIQLPLQLEYHLLDRPVNPYLIGGVQWNYDVANNSRTRQEEIVKLESQYWQLNAGLGIDIPIEKWKFKFHPEIVYAFSPTDILGEQTTTNEMALDSYRTEMLSLKLNFSGI